MKKFLIMLLLAVMSINCVAQTFVIKDNNYVIKYTKLVTKLTYTPR